MSFIITVYTNEGIVMASDSRITYNNTQTMPDGTIQKNIGVQITDTAYKTFICNSRIGLSACGDASINSAPIAGYIEDFISKNITEDSSVEEISQKILDYFSNCAPKLDANFFIAGYNKDDEKQYVSRVYTLKKQIVPEKTDIQGALWDGEKDILLRLVKNVGIKQTDNTYSDLKQFNIGFNYFTLQDAIDFAQYAVDSTIKTIFLQDRVKTVGGPIDILAIKPSGAFWIQRKELHA